MFYLMHIWYLQTLSAYYPYMFGRLFSIMTWTGSVLSLIKLNRKCRSFCIYVCHHSYVHTFLSIGWSVIQCTFSSLVGPLYYVWSRLEIIFFFKSLKIGELSIHVLLSKVISYGSWKHVRWIAYEGKIYVAWA